METSKLELLSEIFSDVSGEEIVIYGNMECFKPLLKELENIKGGQQASFVSEKKENTISSVVYLGNTYFFVDKMEFKNLMEK